VAALRTLALVDRENIVYERDPAITTETIRLHRLVREVAAARLAGDARDDAWRALIAAPYPLDEQSHLVAARCAALTPHAPGVVPDGSRRCCGEPRKREPFREDGLLFHGRAAYTAARPLFERALAIREKASGPEHPYTALSLNNLALLLKDQGDLSGARPL
jgi:hypothetical protein